MAEYFRGSVSCVIPLKYRCSQCGKEAAAVIPLSDSYSGSYCILHGSKESQVEDAKYKSISRLRNKVSEIYQSEPIKCKENILGKCSSCGHTEIWQTTEKQRKRDNVIAVALAVAVFVGWLVVPMVFEKLFLFIVYPVAVMGLLIGYSMISQKIQDRFPTKKHKAKQKELDSIPQENRPEFMLSCKEMIGKIK